MFPRPPSGVPAIGGQAEGFPEMDRSNGSGDTADGEANQVDILYTARYKRYPYILNG